MFKSGNPALPDNTLRQERATGAPMTLSGTVNKTAMLLALALITAGWTWGQYFQTVTEANPLGNPAVVMPYLLGGLIGGLVFALITIFAKKAAPFTAPLYALAEGLLIGAISAFYEVKYPGIVIPAVALTFGTLAAMLAAYKTGLIRPTEKFKLGVVAATGAVALLYLVNIVIGFFGHSIGFIQGGGVIGIGFSLIVVTIAALNLVLDFEFIESGVSAGAPKYMEWYGAFGLLVTLIWLYLEIIRLLSKLRSR